MRGVPLRLEIGPKDIEKAQVFSARRDTREKASMPMDGLAGARRRRCSTRSRRRSSSARSTFREEHTTRVASLRRVQGGDGRPSRLRRSRRGAGARTCEAQIKAETQATMRNIPFGSEPVGRALREVRQAGDARAWFAKAY